MDSYLTAISFAFTSSALICAPLSNILVPELSQIQHEKQIGGIATNIVSTFYPYLVGFSLIGFIIQNVSDQIYLNHNVITSAIAWFLLPLNFCVLVFSSVVQVKKGFLCLGIIAVIPSLMAFFVCLFASSKIGIRSALIGQLFGSIIVGFYLLKMHAADCVLSEGINKRIIQNLPNGFLATLVFTIYPISDSYWGKIVGVSTVSHLAYAQKILVGLSGLIVSGANIIAFQRIANFASEGKKYELKFYLLRKIITILELLIPIAIIVGVIAKPLGLFAIKKINTGRINAEDVLSMSRLVETMLIGMIFMSTINLIFKAFIADGKSRLAASISLTGSLIYFLMSGILQYFGGSIGIAYSYIVTWGFVFFISTAKYFTCNFIRDSVLSANSEINLFLMRSVFSVSLSWWVLNHFSFTPKQNADFRIWTILARVASIVLVFVAVRLICISRTVAALRRLMDVIFKYAK